MVGSAFNFGRGESGKIIAAASDPEVDPDSGADQLKSDDICAIIVRGKVPGVQLKMVFMVICKFLKFGPLNTRAQLGYAWNRDYKF